MVTVESLEELEGTPHARAFPGAEPHVVRLRLAAGERVPPHGHPDRQVVLHQLSGELELHLGDECHRLRAGSARFEGDQRIAPVARSDAVALLVLARRPP